MDGDLVVVDDVAADFAERFVDAFHARPGERFSVALSGGDTARQCYQRLAGGRGAELDWGSVDVYWGDERCVPLDDPASNALLARQALLDAVGASSVHPMTCDDVDGYDGLIRSASPLDLVHLGLGPDGHTASLFPQSPALEAPAGVLVTTNEDPLGNNPHPRLTFTFEAIALARLVIVTVAGSSKQEAMQRVADGADVPASRIRAERVVWLVDNDAAPT